MRGRDLFLSLGVFVPNVTRLAPLEEEETAARFQGLFAWTPLDSSIFNYSGHLGFHVFLSKNAARKLLRSPSGANHYKRNVAYRVGKLPVPAPRRGLFCPRRIAGKMSL